VQLVYQRALPVALEEVDVKAEPVGFFPDQALDISQRLVP
jgi:hypothetical protein